MSDGWNWWAGDNDEHYRVGPCESRDEALAEATDYFGDAETIFLIEACVATWGAPSADSVIGDMLDNCDDLFAEDYPDGLDGTKEEQAEAEKELQAALDGWMAKWSRIFPTPTRFACSRNHETVAQPEQPS